MERSFRQQDRTPAIEPDERVLSQRDRNRLESEPLLQLARNWIVFLLGQMLVRISGCGDAEHQSAVFLGRDQDIDMFHERFLHRSRFLGAPEFAAVIQVVADGESGFLCGAQRFRRHLSR